MKQKFTDMGQYPKGTLAKTCVLLDTSGSMHIRSASGVSPILPAVSLAALITQVNHPAFKNAYIRFSRTAAWKNYGEGKSLHDIVQYMSTDGDWGGTTNFASAMELILKTCIEHKVPNEDVPDLLVLSDMQFDVAGGFGTGSAYDKKPTYSQVEAFEPHYKIIQNSFKKAGYTRLPTIRFWNLASDTVDFPAQANTQGVELYSGFSPNLLKHFMEGTLTQFKAEVPPTPYQTMRKILDDARYDSVRTHLSNLSEGVFRDYMFTPAESGTSEPGTSTPKSNC
jgi:hypothetical protein